MAKLIVTIPIKDNGEHQAILAAFRTLREVRGACPSVEDELRLCDATDVLVGLAEYVEAGVIHERADETTFWED
jgi:hypothetical protein